MRFMMIMYPKDYATAKAGTVPDFKDMEAMGKYNEELGKAGVLVALDGLTPPSTMSARVTFKNGKSKVTDGPYAETKEQLGGIQVLEARDLNHAIQLISQSPGVKLNCGTIEIRPAADIKEIITESEQRRRKDISR